MSRKAHAFVLECSRTHHACTLTVCQVVGKNNLEDKVFVMESPEELPYLKRVIEGSGCADADGEQPVDILNCDMLMGEPFYYRVRVLEWIHK